MILFRIIYCTILFIPVKIAAQVSADTAFINNSDKWALKGEPVFSWKSYKPGFGPFETLEISKGKKERKKLGKETSLMGSTGKLGIVKTVDRKISQPLSISVLYNKSDSIFIDMVMVNITRNSSEIIQLGKNKQPEAGSSVMFAEEILMESMPDTTQWQIKSLLALVTPFSYDTPAKVIEYSGESGTVSNNSIQFDIRPAMGFPVKGKIRKANWLWGSSGYLFLAGEKQVAGIQFTPEMTVWILKDQPVAIKKILGSAIIAIITSKTFKNLD